jgi:hypothetical protein
MNIGNPNTTPVVPFSLLNVGIDFSASGLAVVSDLCLSFCSLQNNSYAYESSSTANITAIYLYEKEISYRYDDIGGYITFDQVCFGYNICTVATPTFGFLSLSNWKSERLYIDGILGLNWEGQNN